MKLELNKVYEFNLGNMSHCGMSHEEMVEHYKSNSSPMSFLSEKILPKRFDTLVYDPTAHLIEHNGTEINIKPDLRDKQTRTTLYDQKAFSKKGGNFTRSSMKGIGRVFNKELNEAWAKAQIFIWTDFCDLPKLRVIALTGKECLNRWPNGKIKVTERENLFSE
jgi:hypothetical protein|tara:strand:+ start:47 stop:538 length:492 start_codon:yes stop_codon:yes gene_type:complete